jgi:hypothetical protein
MSGYTLFTYKPSSTNSGHKINLVQDYDENNTLALQREVEYVLTKKNSSPVNTSYDDFLLSSTADWAKYRIATTYNQSDGYSLTKGVVEASKEVIVYQGTKANNNGFEKFVYQSPFDEQYRDIISNITSIPAETGSGSVKGIFPFPKNEDRD